MKAGRKKKPSKKPAKKKVNKKRAVKRRVSFSTKKRRGKEIYDIDLPTGHKSESELHEMLENIKLTFRDLPDNQVKFTFLASKRKQKASMSFIYDVDEKQEIKEGFTAELKDIFKKKTEREKTKSWTRIQPIKNYISRIIVDFESTD